MSSISWKLMILDVVVWLYTWYMVIGKVLSIYLTIYWDPFNKSNSFIKDTFKISNAPCEYERRIVSWFYRWNDTPNSLDWINCINKFGLTKCPTHTLELKDKNSIVINIDFNKDNQQKGSRSIEVLINGQNKKIAGPITLGNLNPIQLIQDSFKI